MDRSPTIENRPEQAYAGKRVVMPMSEFGEAIPTLMADLAQSLDDRGVKPSGSAFIRYHVIDMPDRMDMEVGLPVDGADADAELPAGRYAVLIYVGVENGLSANTRLVDWIADQGEETVSHASENGDVFKSRLETFLTDVSAEPDQSRWETEIAIKLRDKAPGAPS